jgi:hypothetical protein
MKTRVASLISLLLLLSCSGTSDDKATDTGTPGSDVAVEDTAAPEDVAAPEDMAAPEDTAAPEDMAAPEDVAAPEDTAGALKGFGEVCAVNEDCESNICNEFGQLGPLCTISCETGDDCPEGSEGKKCNNKGVCKP